MWKDLILSVALFAGVLSAQNNSAPITIAGIEIQNTHLPKESVMRLLGLQVGQTVDDNALLAACDKVSRTGLVADIDYSFKPRPGSSGVVVIFKFFDESPLLPATVFPQENESAVWACLQGADPIFMRELPNTKGALKFYVANLDKCLAMTATRPLHAEAKVRCDANLKPAAIEFRIVPGSADQNGLPPRGTVN